MVRPPKGGNAHVVGLSAAIVKDGKLPRADETKDMVRRLRELASETGDSKFTKAANALEGKGRGNVTKDDRLALARCRALVAERYASSESEAAEIVAADIAGQSAKSTAERLRKKLRAARNGTG